MKQRSYVWGLVFLAAVLMAGCDRPSNQDMAFLQYEGQQIDPYCMGQFLFDDVGDVDEGLSLAACTQEGREDYVSEFSADNGRLIQKMQPKEEGNTPMYYTYKYLGGDAQRFTIEIGANTGGSGFFTAIVYLSRDNDALHELDSAGGGDRCNGGITGESRYEDGELFYSRSLTPADMYEMEGLEEGEKLSELEYCAICCAASANFKNDDVISYTLLAEYVERDSDYEGIGKQQACFNHHLIQQLNGADKTLSPSAFEDFLRDTAAACH